MICGLVDDPVCAPTGNTPAPRNYYDLALELQPGAALQLFHRTTLPQPAWGNPPGCCLLSHWHGSPMWLMLICTGGMELNTHVSCAHAGLGLSPARQVALARALIAPLSGHSSDLRFERRACTHARTHAHNHRHSEHARARTGTHKHAQQRTSTHRERSLQTFDAADGDGPCGAENFLHRT